MMRGRSTRSACVYLRTNVGAVILKELSEPRWPVADGAEYSLPTYQDPGGAQELTRNKQVYLYTAY